MELSDPLELNIKIPAHPVEADAVFLKDLATLVQQVDDVIELAACHVEAVRFGNPRDSPMSASLDWHEGWSGWPDDPSVELVLLPSRVDRPSPSFSGVTPLDMAQKGERVQPQHA